jgi:hypothetical protein
LGSFPSQSDFAGHRTQSDFAGHGVRRTRLETPGEVDLRHSMGEATTGAGGAVKGGGTGLALEPRSPRHAFGMTRA